jgi:hypothetical protein
MQAVIDFVMNHSVVMAAALVGILDFIIALAPGLESNGILHGIYSFLKNLASKKES